MNLPNKLTVLRVLMVPFFVLFMLTDLGERRTNGLHWRFLWWPV